MHRLTKPNAPSVFASRAQDPVSNGKPRLGSRMPALRNHYQLLPPPGMIHTRMKPIDYIGLYLMVIVASGITVNWLFRIYF